MNSSTARNSPRQSQANESNSSDRIEALLSRCALRDASALNELYQSVAPQLLGVLMRLLKNRAIAEEALQDVIVRVWQRAGQFEAYRGRGMAWLVSIARNRAIDVLRTQRATISIDDETTQTSSELKDESTQELLELSATDKMRAALGACMQALSRQQRECITLAYVNGYSHDEIARSVGSPLGSVKSWVRRGLTSLKRCLES